VIVGIEGGKPHDPAVAALHPPHPLHGLRVEPAHCPIQRDTAEDLHSADVLAGEPRAVGGNRHVALEDHSLHLAGGGEGGELLVVHRTPEDIGCRGWG